MPSREPTQKEIDTLLDYQNGTFVWKKRGVGKVDTQFAGKTAGCLRPDGYIYIAWNAKHILAHRLAWILHNESIPDGMIIDHTNQNRADNRIENLRLCVVSQNNCNSKLRKDNTSSVKGVGWSKQRRKWRVRLKYKGKEYTVGFYESLDDAEKAIQEKRNQVHQEFASHQVFFGGTVK